MRQPNPPRPTRAVGWPFLLAAVVATVVSSCAVYANLSFAVHDPADYAYFPPFEPNVNRNMNHHLGAGYINIAQALVAGKGFAHPFARPTGPTAWMPPVLPAILAGLLWACDGDRDAVVTAVVCLQELTLVGTGLLVLALAQRTLRRVGLGLAAALFLGTLVWNFRLGFQFTHDCWLVLLVIDLLIAGLCWGRPFRSVGRAAAWGAFGGFCALVSPVVGFTWGTLALAGGWRQRRRVQLATALVAAGLVVAPWVVRNYVTFGRLIPIKSNLAFELYQSQVLQPDGVLQNTCYQSHPYSLANPEGKEYWELGEIAYLDRKREQFWDAVRADPLDLVSRVTERFLAATVLYVPFDRQGEARRPWVLWLDRLLHPLPFLALVVLVATGRRWRLHPAQWAVVGVYLVYLLPYVAVSYYPRYVFPLLGAQVLLVLGALDRLLRLGPR